MLLKICLVQNSNLAGSFLHREHPGSYVLLDGCFLFILNSGHFLDEE